MSIRVTARVLAAWLFSSGCATYVQAQREQRPLYLVQSDAPGVSILDVSVPDEVLARAPNDFANMAGLVIKVARDYADARGGFTVVDATHLGFKPKWERAVEARTLDPTMRVRSLDGVPMGVQTPLVSVVRVLDWRTYVETYNNRAVDVARVQLVMSTWTREGRLVNSETVDALARAGDPFLHLKAGNSDLVFWYQKSDGREHFFHQPAERDQLFMNALREAVGVHYYPFFPHQVLENIALVADGPLKPGVQAAARGSWDDALAAWKAVSDADPNAHGALYDQAMAYLVRGDDETARALLAQAAALENSGLYSGMLRSVEARLRLRREVTPAGEVNAPAPPPPGS